MPCLDEPGPNVCRWSNFTSRVGVGRRVEKRCVGFPEITLDWRANGGV